MIDIKALLPILKNSFPGKPEAAIMEALQQLAQAHPELNNMQALAAIQRAMQEKQKPSIGMMARKGAIQ